MSKFYDALSYKFNDAVASRAHDFFNMLGLPAPEEFDEYLSATAGFLVFISMAGVVIRIEPKQYDQNVINDRIDHPLVIQPLGTIDLGEHVIEVCPATRLGAQHSDCENIDFLLQEDGYALDDHQAANLGYLTNERGENTIVIIDRLAAVQLYEACDSTSELLEKYGNPQAQFASLKKSFRLGAAHGDLRSFARDAVLATDRGLLIPGWDEDSHLHDLSKVYNKTPEAKLKAANYTTRIVNQFSR